MQNMSTVLAINDTTLCVIFAVIMLVIIIIMFKKAATKKADVHDNSSLDARTTQNNNKQAQMSGIDNSAQSAGKATPLARQLIRLAQVGQTGIDFNGNPTVLCRAYAITTSEFVAGTSDAEDGWHSFLAQIAVAGLWQQKFSQPAFVGYTLSDATIILYLVTKSRASTMKFSKLLQTLPGYMEEGEEYAPSVIDLRPLVYWEPSATMAILWPTGCDGRTDGIRVIHAESLARYASYPLTPNMLVDYKGYICVPGETHDSFVFNKIEYKYENRWAIVIDGDANTANESSDNAGVSTTAPAKKPSILDNLSPKDRARAEELKKQLLDRANALSSKSESRTSETITVHILDQFGGKKQGEITDPQELEELLLGYQEPYRTESWIIGKDVPKDIVEKFRDPATNSIYVLVQYKEGKPEPCVVKQSIWQMTKSMLEKI